MSLGGADAEYDMVNEQRIGYLIKQISGNLQFSMALQDFSQEILRVDAVEIHFVRWRSVTFRRLLSK